MGENCFPRVLVIGLVFLSAWPILASWGEAQSLVIGVSRIPEDFNVLDSEHEAGWLARRALLAGLTRVHREPLQGNLSYRLAMADGLRIDKSRLHWVFRTRSDVMLSNGDKIGEDDLRFSMERCLQKRMLVGVEAVKYQRLRSEFDGAGGWEIEFILAAPDAGFGAALAACPIVHQRSAKLFGNDLGRGTNLVAAGRYELVDFYPGRQIVLRLTRYARSVGGGGPEELVIRGFDDDQAGLTALRVGTISALLWVSDTVFSKAERDETLMIEECEGRRLVRRKSFNFGCKPDLDIADFKTEN